MYGGVRRADELLAICQRDPRDGRCGRSCCGRFTLASTMLGITALASLTLASSPRYSLTKTYPLGGDGGWDLLTFDPSADRVFISRATHVVVMDANSGEIVGDIPDTDGVHGIALAPELDRGFTSNGRANTVTVFSLKTLKPMGVVKTGDKPDAIVYDAVTKRVFTLTGGSNDATAIDATSGSIGGILHTVPRSKLP
jgi:DNA-binding beta-propeller fold protein YncE